VKKMRIMLITSSISVKFSIIVTAFFLFSCSGLAESNSSSKITSYQGCVEAGYPIMRSFPAQCMTPDGRVFVDDQREEANEQKICVDRCGDGVCHEIVCLGQGCPCPETPESCPADCGRE